MTRRAAALAAGLALALLAAPVAGCGVKGPPRPSGAPEKAPPPDVLQPRQETAR